MVFVVDLGTQSLRAVIFDRQGNILAKKQIKFENPYKTPSEGRAIQDVAVYWNAFCEASKYLRENHSDLMDKVIAVSLTTFRDSVVCLDEKGEPLDDAILWLDQRKAECKTIKIPLLNRIAFAIVGMTPTLHAQRAITRSNWIIENQPEVWEKTYKFAFISTYLVNKLTGRLVDSVSSQIGHIPLDYKRRKWKSKHDIQQPVFNVPREKLVDLVQPGGVMGYITKQAAQATGLKEGLRVIATGSDKGCESLGCGVTDKKTASISLGTSASIQFASEKYVEPEPFLPAYPSVSGNYYNPEVQVYRGYWMLTWFLKQFAQEEIKQAHEQGISPEEILNELLPTVPAGCDGLVLQPYWSPLLKYPEARGAIIGFSDTHTKAHVYRAIIEGIGFALLEGLKTMEKRMHTKITSVTISGGGSRSDEICRIMANILGVPVKRIQTYEACALGCALAVYVAEKQFDGLNSAIKSMVHYEKPFLPDMKEHKVYKKMYSKVYSKLYGKLRSLYKHID